MKIQENLEKEIASFVGSKEGFSVSIDDLRVQDFLELNSIREMELMKVDFLGESPVDIGENEQSLIVGQLSTTTKRGYYAYDIAAVGCSDLECLRETVSSNYDKSSSTLASAIKDLSLKNNATFQIASINLYGINGTERPIGRDNEKFVTLRPLELEIGIYPYHNKMAHGKLNHLDYFQSEKGSQILQESLRLGLDFVVNSILKDSVALDKNGIDHPDILVDRESATIRKFKLTLSVAGSQLIDPTSILRLLNCDIDKIEESKSKLVFSRKSPLGNTTREILIDHGTPIETVTLNNEKYLVNAQSISGNKFQRAYSIAEFEVINKGYLNYVADIPKLIRLRDSLVKERSHLILNSYYPSSLKEERNSINEKIKIINRILQTRSEI
jgi:hypothetical protein